VEEEEVCEVSCGLLGSWREERTVTVELSGSLETPLVLAAAALRPYISQLAVPHRP
jgi:hypothetical protein